MEYWFASLSPVTLILVNIGLLWKILSFYSTQAWEYHLLLFYLLLIGADYVISSNTIQEFVLGTTHVDTWYSCGKQLYSSHYLSWLENLCKALLGGQEFLFIKDKDRSEQLYYREGFQESTWQLVAFLARLELKSPFQEKMLHCSNYHCVLTKSYNIFSFQVLIWCDIVDYCLIINVNKVVAITFLWWCCSELMMKRDMERLWDISVLMKIYSVVTFDQIFLAKS